MVIWAATVAAVAMVQTTDDGRRTRDSMNIAVIIPAYNGQALPLVLRELPRAQLLKSSSWQLA